eukprot:Opistho-2@33829
MSTSAMASISRSRRDSTSPTHRPTGDHSRHSPATCCAPWAGLMQRVSTRAASWQSLHSLWPAGVPVPSLSTIRAGTRTLSSRPLHNTHVPSGSLRMTAASAHSSCSQLPACTSTNACDALCGSGTTRTRTNGVKIPPHVPIATTDPSEADDVCRVQSPPNKACSMCSPTRRGPRNDAQVTCRDAAGNGRLASGDRLCAPAAARPPGSRSSRLRDSQATSLEHSGRSASDHTATAEMRWAPAHLKPRNSHAAVTQADSCGSRDTDRALESETSDCGHTPSVHDCIAAIVRPEMAVLPCVGRMYREGIYFKIQIEYSL